MRPLLAVAVGVLAWLGTTPAAAAPGRVALPVGLPAPGARIDVPGEVAAVALPDGGAVLVSPEPGRGLVAVRIRADGAPDPSFGQSGVARVAAPFAPRQVLRDPAGRLLVVGLGALRSTLEYRQLTLLRLTPGGALDPAFGEAGIATPGLQLACAACRPAALQRDGRIVVTGGAGSAATGLEWRVARLTDTGALDMGFGAGGTAAIPGPGGTGSATAVLDDGRIAVWGGGAGGVDLTRLLPNGAPDPAFHGGVPVTAPLARGSAMLVRADGSVVLAGERGGARLVRYGPGGALDAGFGVPRLPGRDLDVRLLGDGGGILAYSRVGYEPRASSRGDLALWRVGAGGAVRAGRARRLGFGGGLVAAGARGRLSQTSFTPGQVVRRPDGSLLVAGDVRLVSHGADGASASTRQLAAAALTAGLRRDPRLGGPGTPPRVVVRPASRRSGRSVGLRLGVSAPGLAHVRVTAGQHVLAEGLEPVFAAGRFALAVPATPAGTRLLHGARPVRALVTVRYRDLLAQSATARARARL